MKSKIFFTILLFIASIVSAAENKLYQIIKVNDGDTFIASDGVVKFKVRIAGIDTPEYKQPYGKLAKYRLAELIDGKQVSLKPLKRSLDRYNRVLAHVFLKDKDVGLLMIQEGLAFYYRPGCVDYPQNKKKYDFDPRPYVEAENKAKLSKKYIWTQKNPQNPCLYRKGK